MPKIDAHLRLANRNQFTLTALMDAASSDEHDDSHDEWIATIAFYKAVQLAEALRVKQTGRGSTDHKTRNDWVRVHHPLLYKHLRPLYQSSLVARYLGYSENGNSQSFDCFANYMSGGVVDKLVKRRLVPFENALLQVIQIEFERARF